MVHTDDNEKRNEAFPFFSHFQQPLQGLTAQVDDENLAQAFTMQVDYLLGFDPERFLVEFRRNAGLDTKGLTTYGGWEAGSLAEDNPDDAEYPADQELREKTGDLQAISSEEGRKEKPLRFTGHYFGHWMRACEHVLHSSNINDSQRHELARKAASAVLGLRETQLAFAAANPEDAGYLPAYPVAALPSGADGVMVPFYNLHKVLQGLIDLSSVDFEAFGVHNNGEKVAEVALRAACDFAQFISNWSARNPDVALLDTEYGGMNEALYNLALAERKRGETDSQVQADARAVSTEEELEQHGSLTPEQSSLQAPELSAQHAELLAARTAHLFDELDLFIRLAAGEDCLPGLHVNTTIPKLIGAARALEVFVRNSQCMDGIANDIREHAAKLHIALDQLPRYDMGQLDEKAREIYRADNLKPVSDEDASLVFGVYFAAARNFWQLATGPYAYAIGVPSQAEHFHELDHMWAAANQSGDEDGGYRNPSTCETCCAHNLLRLSYLLMSLSGQASYANRAEVLHRNAILGSRDPHTGMVTYFQPMRAGYAKVYGPVRGEFWCCQGTGLENWTLLGQAAYFSDGDSVYLARALTSTLQISSTMTLTQKDQLSQDGTIRLTFDAPAGTNLSLKLRVPDWATSMVVSSLDDDLVLAPRESWVHVHIEAGETLVLNYERAAKAISHEDNPAWVAFQYGPDVLGEALSDSDPKTNYQYGGILVRVATYDAQTAQRAKLTVDEPVEQWVKQVDQHVKPVAKQMAQSAQQQAVQQSAQQSAQQGSGARSIPRFELTGLDGGEVRELQPYNTLHDSVNAIYFDIAHSE